MTHQTALVAIGGNALVQAKQTGTIAQQRENAGRTCREIARLIGDGLHVLLTHGNGPQVGAALLRSRQAVDQVPEQPLDVCVASTQGEIGYILEQALGDALTAAGLRQPVVTVVSRVIVAADDPAMGRPSKPVGPFYSRAEADRLRCAVGWATIEDAGRGHRRVVPSPHPVEVVEASAIRTLFRDHVIIALGGGGIPVVRDGRALTGVEAVIDKDPASALLASELGVDLLAIVTDVDQVYLDYQTPAQRGLGRITASDMVAHHAEGHFLPGSMGPKVEAALDFLERGGREVVVTSAPHLYAAVCGERGTHIVNDH